MRKIGVLVADAHAVLRDGLRLLLETQPDVRVIGEAEDAPQLLRRLRETRADVVLVDLIMAGMVGTRIIEQILRDHPRVKILVLTGHADPSLARSALAAGVCGYVMKASPAQDLICAIRAVHRGRRFVDPSLAADLLAERDGRRSKRGPAQWGEARPLLSRREEEVLELLARGHTNRESAQRLCVSVKSVETYRARLGQKLGLRTRADFVRYALETGRLAPGKLAPSEP